MPLYETYALRLESYSGFMHSYLTVLKWNSGGRASYNHDEEKDYVWCFCLFCVCVCIYTYVREYFNCTTEYMYTAIIHRCLCVCLLHMDVWLSEGQTDRKNVGQYQERKPFLIIICKFKDMMVSRVIVLYFDYFL